MNTPLKSLKVKFNEIPHGGIEYTLSQDTPELKTDMAEVLGSEPLFSAHLKIEKLENVTQLKGTMSAELNHVCSRCAEDFKSSLNKKFKTLYYRSEDNIKSFSDGVDDLEGSFDLEFLPTQELDLKDVIREQIALEVPFQPLCSEDCKGLCGQCGVNLNLSEEHRHHDIMENNNSPFLRLKELRGE